MLQLLFDAKVADDKPQAPLPPLRRRILRRIVKALLAAGFVAVVVYAGAVTATWLRYGQVAPPTPGEVDQLLDRFMPVYEVAERHHVRVAAPTDVTFRAAAETDLEASFLIRSIISTRAFVLGARNEAPAGPRGLLAQTKAMGWGVLAEYPGREVVMGAVTQPWLGDVVFRALPPDQFAAFNEPGFVKIVWTLRADPDNPGASVFRTETRVATTDADARAKFRWYWARFSPGIVLIRQILVQELRTNAERRVSQGDR